MLTALLRPSSTEPSAEIDLVTVKLQREMKSFHQTNERLEEKKV